MIVEHVAEVFDTILKTDTDQRMLNALLVELNRQQEDLLHEIEFKDCKAKDLISLAKRLRAVRRERRKVKNNLELFQPLIDWRKDNQNAFNKLSQAIGKMRHIEQQHSEAFYKMRSEERSGEVIEHFDTN